MNSSEQSHFEELLSRYLDEGLSPEEELELLQLLDKPAFASAFFEFTRLNTEITGALTAPIPDEKMEALVAAGIGATASNESARICAAVMKSVSEAPVRHALAISTASVPVQSPPRPSLGKFSIPWLVSISFHVAAVIALIFHFASVRPDTSPPRAGESKTPADSDTYTAVARVDSVNGSANTLEASKKTELETQGELSEGQGLETVGRTSSADVSFDDGTTVLLNPDTRISQVFGGQNKIGKGKRVILEFGTLQVSAAPQPADRPMEFVTSNARAIVVGTRFKLTAATGLTRLEVTEGVVRLIQSDGRASVDVAAGKYAVVGSGNVLAAMPLPVTPERRLVEGVNLYGGPVVIEGERWLSHAEALARGLTIDSTEMPGASPSLHTQQMNPIPPVDNETRIMLSTRAYSFQKDMGLSQPLPNGDYEVFMWVAEKTTANYRLFDVQIGDSIWRGIGRLPYNGWKKYGPFRTQVTDGKLQINLKRIYGNPVLSGLAIYSIQPDRPSNK